METTTNTPIKITVEATVNTPVEKVWEAWTKPVHIVNWNYASDDWHTTKAENDLSIGGKFNSRMEAKDGSVGFDFWGLYDAISKNELIEYTMGDGRKAQIVFYDQGEKTNMVITFEAETENSIELQRGGWQAILDNFKKYTKSI